MVKPTLSVEPGTFAVSRLAPNAEIPDWALRGVFSSVTKTPNEISIICPQSDVPADVKSQKNWAALRVVGVLDFSLTGILFGILEPLAQAKISVFTLSTFDTDFVLIQKENLIAAIHELEAAGYKISD